MKPLVEVDTLTDLDLLRRSIDDPELFGRFFDRHGTRVFAHLAANGFAAQADALTVEVFTIAFRRRGEYRAERDSALPWLLGIARNVTRNDRRSDRRWVRSLRRGLHDDNHDDRAAHDDAESRVDAGRAKGALHDALDALPREQREVLVLFALDELTYAEIAEVTGAAIGTVRSRLHRARAAVRTRLATAGISLDREGATDG